MCLVWVIVSVGGTATAIQNEWYTMHTDHNGAKLAYEIVMNWSCYRRLCKYILHSLLG